MIPKASVTSCRVRYSVKPNEANTSLLKGT